MSSVRTFKNQREEFSEKMIIKTGLNTDYIKGDYISKITPENQRNLHSTVIANSLLKESNSLGLELSRILELINRRILVSREQIHLTSLDIRKELDGKEYYGPQIIGEVSETIQNSDIPMSNPMLEQIKADISYYTSYIKNYMKVLVKINEDLKMYYTIIEMKECYIEFCKNMIQEIEEEQKMKSNYYSIEELEAFKSEYMSDMEQIEIVVTTTREKIKKMEEYKKILEENLRSVREKLQNAERKYVMLSPKKERRSKIKKVCQMRCGNLV